MKKYSVDRQVSQLEQDAGLVRKMQERPAIISQLDEAFNKRPNVGMARTTFYQLKKPSPILVRQNDNVLQSEIVDQDEIEKFLKTHCDNLSTRNVELRDQASNLLEKALDSCDASSVKALLDFFN